MFARRLWYRFAGKHAKKLLYILDAGFVFKLPVMEQSGVKTFQGYQGTAKW
jgi:hypothetical protein